MSADKNNVFRNNRSFREIADSLFIPCVICLYLFILAVSFVAKMDPYIWYDEAAQVWIGKGLYLDALPLQPDGGIKGVIEGNHDYNMDPGGLGLIIYFWEKVSMHYIWLRLLPFIFFILTVICSGYLAFRWTSDRNLSLVAALAPCMVPLLFYEGFEIRAYSMEVLGVYLSVIALGRLSDKLSLRRLAVWSCVLSVFLTSRYSFIPVAFVASIYVIYLIYKSSMPASRKLGYAAVYALPLFFTLFAIYMMAMRIQNPAASSLSYLGYLRYCPVLLIKKKSLCYMFFIAFVILFMAALTDKTVLKKYRVIIYMLLATTGLYMILSFLGVQPWILTNYNARTGSRWCISLIALATITLSALVCGIFKAASNKMDAKYLLFALVCFQFVYTNGSDIKHFRHRDTPLTEYQSVMKPDSHIFIDRGESPSMRYQFEYGALKGTRINYPDGITFTRCEKHCINEDNNGGAAVGDTGIEEWYDLQPPLDSLTDYDIIVANEMKIYKVDGKDKWTEVGECGVFVKK